MIKKKFLGTAELAYHLNATGRPILFSCEFPLYEMQGNIKVIQVIQFNF